MIALWMAYAVGVAVLLGGAAAALETTLRAGGKAGRWPWAAALAGSWLLPAGVLHGARSPSLAGIPAGLPPSPVPAAPAAVAGSALAAATVPWIDRIGAALQVVRAALDPAGAALVVAWGLLATCGLLLFVVTARSLLREARRWPVTRLLGETVRLSPTFGPAVVGVRRPAIVLPAWVLALDGTLQRLVLRHEVEHRTARDTQLLAAGAVATLAMPWNPALWWQLRRLQLAVEVDCDRRVLGSGVSSRRYGDLLLSVGERMRRWTVPVAALSEPRSFLERRLEMIARRRVRRGAWTGVAGVMAAGLLVVIACEAPAPTAMVEEGDGAAQTVEEARQGVVEAAEGVVRTRLRSQSDTIDSISVESGEDGSRVVIREQSTFTGKGQPLFVIDGKWFGTGGEGLARDLDMERVESISVLRGAAAVALYGSRAANGAVIITTRDGGGIAPAALEFPPEVDVPPTSTRRLANTSELSAADRARLMRMGGSGR